MFCKHEHSESIARIAVRNGAVFRIFLLDVNWCLKVTHNFVANYNFTSTIEDRCDIMFF